MSKLPEEKREVFTVAYRYYEEHWDMPNTGEAWTKAVDQMRQIIDKYGYSPLLSGILLACNDEIEKDQRGTRKVVVYERSGEQNGTV